MSSVRPRCDIAGRYRTEARLGSGGMATVYRVVDETEGRRVALKRLSAKATARMSAMFEREYHALAGLRHPLIIEVYDYGLDADGPYYTMELLAGHELKARAPMPWIEVCRCLRDVASALALLHARRLLHRDISPRNVWRTNEGRFKLLDFGALAAFGTCNEVVGTPPCLAPEALRGGVLDQRTDLYALGALGYWLLTGSHAYAARELKDLAAAWREPLQAPSARVQALREAGAALEVPPKPLDELVLALLSHEPLARPVNAVEVIDRLIPIAELPAQEDEQIASSYLASNAFVGRDPERRDLRARVDRLCERKGGGTVLVEASAGLGKSRLLREIALDARVAGGSVIVVDAALHRGFHGLLGALALELLDTLPDIALECARAHARVLAHASAELHARLGSVSRAEMPSAPGEARLRIQAAMEAWVLDLCARRALVLAIDNLQQADEGSAAWLAALSQHATASHPLLIVATVGSDDEAAIGPAVHRLRERAQRVTLEHLSREGTLQLVQSMFGDAACASRLSDWLHKLTGGNPGQCMELAHHLVKQELIRYLDGSWLLPEELFLDRRPTSVSEAQQSRLARLSDAARAVGQTLSLHDGPLSLRLCTALAGVDHADAIFPALDSLLREGVLAVSHDGYRFTQPALRESLCLELTGARRVEAHRRLGAFLLASGPSTAVQKLEAGLHLLLGRDDARGAPLVTTAGVELSLGQTDSLRLAVPMLEEVERLYRARKRPERELIAILTPLAVAGFHVDWRLAIRYADEALGLMQDALGLTLASRLRPVLGGRLSLAAGMAWAAARWSLATPRGRLPRLGDAFTMLCTSVAALTGVDALCMDGVRALRHARVLEPLAVLGPHHAASVLYELCRLLTMILSDRMQDTHAGLTRLIARLDSEKPIAGLPAQSRIECLGGALYALGILESRRDGPGAPQIAERLEQLGMKVYEIAAHQIRTEYLTQQGDAAAAAEHRACVELYAMQRGTAWQAEIWGTTATLLAAVRTDNGPVIKQCADRLERRAEEIPSFRSYALTARALHILLRGDPKQAAVLLEPLLQAKPVGTGWVGSLGCLARAYNQMGEHARARDACRVALAHATRGDLSFVTLNQIVETELALAEAGLGDADEAARSLDALIAERSPARGPLTLGWLHEARCRVALHAGDAAGFQRHLQETRRWFEMTHAPALIARCESLEKQASRGSAPKWRPAPQDDETDSPPTIAFRRSD